MTLNYWPVEKKVKRDKQKDVENKETKGNKKIINVVPNSLSGDAKMGYGRLQKQEYIPQYHLEKLGKTNFSSTFGKETWLSPIWQRNANPKTIA